MLANLSSKHSWHRIIQAFPIINETPPKTLQESWNRCFWFSKMWEVQNWDGLPFSRPPALIWSFQVSLADIRNHCIIQSQVYKHIFLRVDTSMSWGLIEKPGLFLRHTPQFCEMAKANLQDGWLIARLIFNELYHRFFLGGSLCYVYLPTWFFLGKNDDKNLHKNMSESSLLTKHHQTWRPSGKITNERTHWTGPTRKRPEYWDVHGSDRN